MSHAALERHEPSGTVTPKDIWDILRRYLTPVQAAGLMGNAIAESSLNPEASVQDSNGYQSVGLFQFNEQSYPNAGSLVTGSPLKDAEAQVKFALRVAPKSALDGSTPSQVASNWATNFERCQTCEPGGASNQQRESNATQVAGWAGSGNWPATSMNADDQASSGAQESASCAWSISLPIAGQSCILSKTQ